MAERALSIAREKAAARRIDAEFMVADALHLDRLGRLERYLRTPERLETRFNAQGTPAWLAKIKRIQ